MTAPYLDSFRAQFGARRKISREQLCEFLATQGRDNGLPLAAYAGWYGAADTDAPEEIARAIANAPQGIAVLSLGGQVRDIQRDDPGSMHPMQHAQLSFVAPDLSGSTMEYLRRHADRVIAVTGDAIQRPAVPAPPPHKSPYYCPSCAEETMSDRGDETKCANCGRSIGPH